MLNLKSTAIPPPLSKKRHYNSICYFNTENGRSLIEMVGMLTIMGILAVAGIWIYNSAMDRVKANTIINEAQKRAVVVAGQIGFQGRTNPSLGEFSENEFAGGTFSTNVVTNGLYQQFGIQVSNVPKAVCQNILNSIDSSTLIRRLTIEASPTSTLTACADKNTLVIVYNHDLSSSKKDPTYCENTNQCKTFCAECTNGACVGECEIPAPVGGCLANSECNQHNECLICDTESGMCKEGCQRVDYLESAGRQWINTGANPSTYNNIISTFSITDTNASRNYVWGSYAFSTSGYGRSQFSYSTSGFCGYGSTYTNDLTLDVNTNIHTVVMKNKQFIVDGNLIWTSETDWDTNTTVNTYLYHVNARNNGSSSGISSGVRIHSWKCFQNETPVRDFIPVIDPQGTPAMFDRISNTLFYNQGTGDFIIPSN